MPTNVPPTLPSSWSDSSSRVTNLAVALNDLAAAVNTLCPVGTSWANWTPALTATTTNPTLGTGSVATGRYFQLGKLVVANFKIQFGTSGTSAGSGAYRVSLPVACSTTTQNNDFVVGYGHLHDASVGFLGLGPGAYRTVTFHNNTAITTSQAGIVLGASPHGWLPTYTVTNGSTDRTFDVTAPTGTYSESIAEETRAVLGTLVGDLATMFPETSAVTDNTAADAPFAWDASDQIIGSFMYEAA